MKEGPQDISSWSHRGKKMNQEANYVVGLIALSALAGVGVIVTSSIISLIVYWLN